MYENERGVFAPNYYKNFKCIADKCKKNCCVGWEIYIDENTLEKYKPFKNILKTVKKDEDGYCFKLRRNGNCPHLNESGLCNIIIDHGEEFLSDICKNHPRFYNQVSSGAIEAGLGIACEEACRLVLKSGEFCLEKISEEADIEEESFTPNFLSDFNALTKRQCVFGLIAQDLTLSEKLYALKNEFKIPSLYSEKEWLDRFLSLEILDSEWEKLLTAAKKAPPKSKDDVLNFDKYFERLLEYFCYRHLSVAKDLENFRAKLGFSILAVEIIKYLFESSAEQSLDSLIEIARAFSSEIEYSEDNVFELIFEFERHL